MKPVMQTRFGTDPHAPGNCFSACVASILECTLDELPDEAKIVQRIKEEHGLEVWQSWPDRFKWGKSWQRLWDATQQACGNRGLAMIESKGPFAEAPDTFCIISGKSPRGDFDHACVGFGRNIVHDPHPSGLGVEEEERLYLFFAAIDPGRKAPSVRWVGQKHARGCGVAALAMLTGHDYDAVASTWPINFDEHGVYLRGMDDYLVDAGYAIARKSRYLGHFSGGGSVPREPWPPEPFGDVHLAEVTVSESSPCNHFVVMLKDGTVLDPLTPEPKRLSDYHGVLNVAAVVKR